MARRKKIETANAVLPMAPADCIGQVAKAVEAPRNSAIDVAKLEVLYATLEEFGLDWFTNQVIRSAVGKRLADIKLRNWR